MNSNLKEALNKINHCSCSDYAIAGGQYVPDVGATDYALMNKAVLIVDGKGVAIWTVDKNGQSFPDIDVLTKTVRPQISVDLNYIDKLGANKLFINNGQACIQFENLKFPNQILSASDAEILSDLKARNSYSILARRKHFFGHVNSKGKMICNKCYEYNGQSYVYVQKDGKFADESVHFSNGKQISEVEDAWFAVSPITWKVENWDKLPTYINPLGDGSEKYLILTTDQAVFGVIPFASKSKNANLYQNSLVRAYLNNYNIHEELKKGNGFNSLKSNRNYNLSDDDGISFLDEFYDDTFIYMPKFAGQSAAISSLPGKEIVSRSVAVQQAQTQTTTQSTASAPASTSQVAAQPVPAAVVQPTKKQKAKKTAVKARVSQKAAKAKLPEESKENEKVTEKPIERKNPFGVTVDRSPMKLKDQLKFYIDNGTSFMLHGPSGVGKTRRVQELDPDLVSITLRDGMLPEEITGKTIYQANGESFWDSPPWYKEICKKCEAQPDKNHVLFIDELSNVRSHEQSLVYHIVLNHSIDHNRGELPKNCVVVAAGNEKADSEAAYTLAEPLFRRFSAHIYLPVDVINFLEWGSERQKANPDRTKIHPLVLSYISTHGVKALHSAYDPEKPPQSTNDLPVDPRAWEQVSDIIYNNNGALRTELIANKVGPAHAGSLLQFAENPPLTLESVLAGSYTTADIPKNHNDKYALALSLRRANESQIEQVRNFISQYLGNEILAMFDSLWCEGDDERALLIAELNGEFDEVDADKLVDEDDGNEAE